MHVFIIIIDEPPMWEPEEKREKERERERERQSEIERETVRERESKRENSSQRERKWERDVKWVKSGRERERESCVLSAFVVFRILQRDRER